jgi:hypothetical protein
MDSRCHGLRSKVQRIFSLPFLHLRSRNIDTVGLSATAHGEVNIEGRQTEPNISLGDNVERGGVIKDVVIQGEFTTENLG